jgi:hypothetical protein
MIFAHNIPILVPICYKQMAALLQNNNKDESYLGANGFAFGGFSIFQFTPNSQLEVNRLSVINTEL